jgi:hypothetical protein
LKVSQRLLTLEDARCPRCGAGPGHFWLETTNNEQRGAYFIVECRGRKWKRSERISGKHLFRVRVTLGYEPKGEKTK